MGIQVGDESMLFAYDRVVLAEDEDDASYIMRKVMEQYEKWGLEINVKKTQYTRMSIGRERNELVTEKGVISGTSEYKYLAVQITEDGKEEKIDRRKAITRKFVSFSLKE